jgi:hypothetical protein
MREDARMDNDRKPEQYRRAGALIFTRPVGYRDDSTPSKEDGVWI